MTRTEEIKKLIEGATSGELLLCPFCDVLPVKGLTQKTGCQLHGDPIQYVTVSCKNNKCPAKPTVKGTVCRYNGDDKPNNHVKATLSAIQVWNTRANSTLVTELLGTVISQNEALESITDNTCCDKCQEAALVAKKALAQFKEWNGV